MPVLKDPSIEWNYPGITSSKWGNSLRTERWRYIKNKKGDELYDMSKDPNEWTNLARNPEYAHIIKEMKTHLPTVGK